MINGHSHRADQLKVWLFGAGLPYRGAQRTDPLSGSLEGKVGLVAASALMPGFNGAGVTKLTGLLAGQQKPQNT